MSNDKFSFYKEYPKNCKQDDFWGQVKRTVNGKAVSEQQIEMIVNAVEKGLCLNKDDVLLDLCCGNGALTDRFFSHCKSGLGVDFSPVLIAVAKRYFERLPEFEYQLDDVVDFCEKHPNKYLFTKAVCYGSFSYLDYDAAEKLLVLLNSKFENIQSVFIGNVPDKDRMGCFFSPDSYEIGIELKPESAIGIWRSQSDFKELANRTGWVAAFTVMPVEYYAHHYRFDVTLTRR
ncbi:class I SAM-dependent methyltransferase [Motilimonas eburnea]|uniref:class I SAM-dependent methyltransferase n=1 Tax=Motilimonas eburnea TaxID=1737488 RepID=UPI001E5A8A98|nr:class I SAM-dependent methyltransferase [Motilimonas eburnea]MCE2571530.1 class I SAM-dependent methyltransferase [Motilimonas eburnea]